MGKIQNNHPFDRQGKVGAQRGMASIVITMVTMVVISLIVIGFATISRREQQQSLDQLLSTQAFYAAESGIEDATTVLKAAIASGGSVVDKSNCDSNNAGGNYPTGSQTIIDASHNVSYSCLLVDQAPSNITYDGVSTQSFVIPITTSAPITSVRITWRPSSATSGNPATSCPAAIANNFTPQSGWTCGYGVLRADLVPTPAGALTSAALASNAANGFFVPTRNAAAGTLNYASALNKATTVAANCNTAAYTQCQATFNNISVATNKLTLRISSMYQPSNIVVEALNGGSTQDISGVQAKIDSTGKANDILRRIQVRVPLINAKTQLTSSALSSNGSVCKRFGSTTGYLRIPGDIVDADSGNDMCQPMSSGTTGGSPCPVFSDVVMVLDRSGSMSYDWGGNSRLDELKIVADNFVDGILVGPPGVNKLALVAFDANAVDMNPGLSTNTASMHGKIDPMTPGLGTHYLTALDKAVSILNGPGSTPGAKKIIVLISDGLPDDLLPPGDPGDTDPASQAAAIAKAATIKAMTPQITLYTVGINADYPGETNPVLATMAGNAPGVYASAEQPADLAAIMANIAAGAVCH